MKVTQEGDHVPGGRVIAVTIGLIVAIAIGVLAAWLVEACRAQELEADRDQDMFLGPVPGVRPGPAAEQRIPAEVHGMELGLFDDYAPGLTQRTRARQRLESYGWVDREAGLVRIPVERAMELYLQQHREETQ